MRYTARVAVLVALVAFVAPSAALARRTDPPRNRFGLPVRDALGRPVSYTASQLRAAERARVPGEADQGGRAAAGVAARWGYAAFGEGIGLSNIVIDAGEIYLGGSASTFGANDYWYVLRHVPTTGRYEQVFVSRWLPGIVGVALGDVVGDSRKELVVARSNGTLYFFDQASRVEVSSVATGASNVLGMTLHDLDSDARPEILLTTTDTLFVFSGVGTLILQLPGAGGRDVIAGQMDADASLEIATTAGVVVDWASRAIQWQRSQGFGIDLEAADIDGDGMQELIAGEAWGFVWSFDVDRQLPKWSLSIFNTGAIWVGNVDADSAVELLVGEDQWGAIRAFNTVTLAEEWSIDNPEHGVTYVAVGDPNRDGIRDVLWGAGASSTGPDRIYVANLAARTIDWQNIQLDGPFLPPQFGDVDGDGRPEMVTASTSADAGYDSGRIVVLDGESLRVRGVSAPIVGNLSWEGLRDLRLRNVDADGALEIVVAADRLYDGVIEIYDFVRATGSFALKWTNPVRPSGAAFRTADVADIDADGALEVVGGVGASHTGSQGTFIYAYDLATGVQEWRTFHLGGYWTGVTGLVILTSGGGVADIVGVVDGESLNIFDGTGQVQAITGGPFSYLGPNATSPGRSFLLGREDGTVLQYDRDGSTYSATWSRGLAATPIDGVGTLPGGRMAALFDGRLSLYPSRDDPPAWVSEDYGVRGHVQLSNGAQYRPFAGGRYGLVSLAPWRQLLDVQPREGLSRGGTLIAVEGTAFDPGAAVYVGGKPATQIQVVDPTLMTGRAPALKPCSRYGVAVVNPDMSFEVMDDVFLALPLGATCPGFERGRWN